MKAETIIGYNSKEEELFKRWAAFLKIDINDFVHDGLLFHDGLMFDDKNWIRTLSGNNTQNWNHSIRKLLIITRDQPCDDGGNWDVRGETALKSDGCSLKKEKIFKCLIPWSYAALYFDNALNGICPDDDILRLGFWAFAPIARINCGKLPGNRVCKGGCKRSKVCDYLKTSKNFLLEQIHLYDANIIMCCTGYDNMSNPVVDFLKAFYFAENDLEKKNNYLWYSKSKRTIVLDTYHFSNPNLKSNEDILKEAYAIRDSILEGIKNGIEF